MRPAAAIEFWRAVVPGIGEGVVAAGEGRGGNGCGVPQMDVACRIQPLTPAYIRYSWAHFTMQMGLQHLFGPLYRLKSKRWDAGWVSARDALINYHSRKTIESFCRIRCAHSLRKYFDPHFD
jgi:hypothetical protein